jgi:hypothetical protein
VVRPAFSLSDLGTPRPRSRSPEKWRKSGVPEVITMKRKHRKELLAQREVASTADPLEVKGLAIAYKITPAQVRALLLTCGRDWLKFDRAAAELRKQ